MDSIYEKAELEYKSYLENLKTKTPQEIINSAYEITIKADILLSIENDLSDDEISVLSKLDMPLQAIYDEWLNNDYSYMEMIRDSVNDYARKELVNNQVMVQEDAEELEDDLEP